jgi:hypothetical protein
VPGGSGSQGSGGNSAEQTIGAVQVGPATVDPGAVVAGTPAAGDGSSFLGGRLPFTALALGAALVAALGLLAGGTALRRAGIARS